jgi:hypothetical protein
VVVVLLVLGCLVFAVIRYRFAERQKALEMEQWADKRRSHGTVNPLYAIPTDDGSWVTVIQDPFRVAGSSNVPLYDLVEPGDGSGDGYDTYGEVFGIDDDEGTGYLDVDSPDYDPIALSPQETTIYDLAQRQNSSGFSRAASFKIPAEDGSSVVAYRSPAGGSETDGEYVVVTGAGSECASLTPMCDPGDNATNPEPAAPYATAFTAESTTDTIYDNAAAGPIPTTSFRKPKQASPTMGLCSHMSSTGKKCAFKSTGPSRYCSNHTCTLGGCFNNKPSGQTVCDEHSIGSIDLYGHQQVVTSVHPDETSTEAEEPPPPRPAKTSVLDGEYLVVPGKQHPDIALASYENVGSSAARSVTAHDLSPYDDSDPSAVVYDTAGPSSGNEPAYDVASAEAPPRPPREPTYTEAIQSGYGSDVSM